MSSNRFHIQDEPLPVVIVRETVSGKEIASHTPDCFAGCAIEVPAHCTAVMRDFRAREYVLAIASDKPVRIHVGM